MLPDSSCVAWVMGPGCQNPLTAEVLHCELQPNVEISAFELCIIPGISAALPAQLQACQGVWQVLRGGSRHAGSIDDLCVTALARRSPRAQTTSSASCCRPGNLHPIGCIMPRLLAIRHTLKRSPAAPSAALRPTRGSRTRSGLTGWQHRASVQTTAHAPARSQQLHCLLARHQHWRGGHTQDSTQRAGGSVWSGWGQRVVCHAAG